MLFILAIHSDLTHFFEILQVVEIDPAAEADGDLLGVWREPRAQRLMAFARDISFVERECVHSCAICGIEYRHFNLIQATNERSGSQLAVRRNVERLNWAVEPK